MALVLGTHASASDEYEELDGVIVETSVDDTPVGTQDVTTSSEIKLYDSAELINPYKAISLLPGVDIRFNDPFGMDITHKIRGKSDRNVGETLEGLPLKGIGPGGGLATMVDIENIDYITVEKGAVKADSGFGYGSDNGMVDMHMKRPLKGVGVTLKQALGSDNFTKTFLRVDTGEIANAARGFASASWTDADKWKGKGKATERKNFEFGLMNATDSFLKWEVYGIYNKESKNLYKGLTYDQSRDLSTYKDLDYGTDDPSSADYYDYHRQTFDTYALLGKMEIPLGADDSVTFRPYFLRDTGTYYLTSGNNIIEWLVDHDTYGLVSEYAHKIEKGEIKLGYWYGQDEPPGPPTSRKLRSTVTYDFIKWERLIDVEKNSIFQAPYMTFEKVLGSTVIEGGVKYLWFSTPTLAYYDASAIGDVSYDTALSQADTKLFTLDSKTYGIFLPNIGATHYVNDRAYVRFSYGRNYNTPQYGLGASLLGYYNNPSSPAYHNEALVQQMWDDLKPEESDNYDLGFGYAARNLKTDMTLFYSDVKNVAGSFYDPALGFTYAQNIAKARSFGAEFSASYHVLPALTTNFSLTYNRYEFTEDVNTAAGTYVNSKGQQIPDIPEFMGNISAVYDLYGYKFAPVLRYLGKRYADVENKYSVDPYWIMDLSLNKEYRLDAKNRLEFSASVTNLFDEEYISTISTSDTNADAGAATYIVGAPRSVFFSMQYKY